MIRGLAKTDVGQEFALCEQDTELSWLEWACERVNMTGQFGNEDYVWLFRVSGCDHGQLEVWKDGTLLCHTYPEEIY